MGRKLTIYDEKIVFKNSGDVFVLKGDVLKLITDYNFISIGSTDAKLNIEFMGGMLLIHMHEGKM